MEISIDYNIMEDILRLKLEEILPQLNTCNCEQCQDKIIETAIKKFPPIYANDPQDYLMKKASILDFQFNADVVVALTLASQEVAHFIHTP